MNTSSIDLNLFVVLQTVLEEGSVTKAAARLHVTQSAVSNSLAKLRTALNDPLFVRKGRSLTPTPAVLEIAPQIAVSIESFEEIVRAQQKFIPQVATRGFTLAVADHHALCDLPQVMKRFNLEMPKASLKVVTVESFKIEALGTTVDAALAPPQAVTDDIVYHRLYRENAVLIVRKDHPTVGRQMTSQDLANLQEIDVQIVDRPIWGPRPIERLFEALGARRNVIATVSRFTTAGFLVSSSDAFSLVPLRFAEYLCSIIPIKIVDVDVSFMGPEIGLVWHRRTHRDPSAVFFRELLITSLQNSSPPNVADPTPIVALRSE